MNTLEVINLSKILSHHQIIKNISFSVLQGEIVGFVGPNGAGKTTTIRMITDLMRPDSGEIYICGKSLSHQRELALANLSGIVETPGLYLNLSGLENLQYIKKMRGVPNQKLTDIVEQIGLSNRINDKVKKYSLGMKQRLAFGMCLLTEPKLLILDEPTNGVDPTGTMELRKLIVQMAEQKGTAVLFSSHLLSEVEKVATRIVFIKEGKIILKNPVHEDISTYQITVSDSINAVTILKDCSFVLSVSIMVGNRLLIQIKDDCFEKVLPFLFAHNITIKDIEKQKTDLEAEYSRVFEVKP